MGGAVSSFFGSGPATPPNLQTYQPQYTSQADTNSFSAINQIQNNNPYLQNQGTYQSIEQQGLNNPYAAGVQTSANAAGQQYGAVGAQGAGVATGLNAGAMTLLPYVSQVENTAMDPQSALYNRTLQQVRDQANVSNAQNGLTGSPYGAGAANSSVNNFNIDWQNNQLARQTQGISAASTGLGAVGAAGNNAQNIGATAAANTGMSGAAPNAAYISNLANMSNALNNYGTSQTAANANTQVAQQDFQQYLTGGENQANTQAKLNQQNYENQQQYVNDQNAQLAGQVNSGLDLASGFGSGFSSGFSSGSNSSAASNSLKSSGFTGSAASSDAEWAAFLAA